MAGTLKLAGKVAVITAGTKGIGLAAARRLGLDGAKVVVGSRKEENVVSAVNELKQENIDAFGVICHSGKTEDVSNILKSAEEHFGGVDIVFSNAGINLHKDDLLKCTTKVWNKNFDVNVTSNFKMCREVVPYMDKRGGGSIIVNSSIAAYLYTPVTLLYGIHKRTLCMLVKALVYELSPRNIRINAIVPGIIKTEFSEVYWRNETKPLLNENSKDMLSKYSEHFKFKSNEDTSKSFLNLATACGRFGIVEECASVVSFLASDESSLINGENIVVTGGIDLPVWN